MGGSAVAFDFSLMLLLAKTDSIAGKISCKRDALRTYNISYVKIILVLLTKVVALNV